MYVNLRVFLISPDKVVVYAFDNSKNNDNYIYNGGSLELISDPEISGYTEIAGSSTPDFKTNPVVLGYANGLFEIVYAPPNMQQVFVSDGSPAQHKGVPVTARVSLQIPNIEERDAGPNTQKLVPFELEAPNMDSIQKYISMAKKGQEYENAESYWELRSKTAEKALPDLTIKNAPAMPPAPALPNNMPQVSFPSKTEPSSSEDYNLTPASKRTPEVTTPAFPTPSKSELTSRSEITTVDVTEQSWYQELKAEHEEFKTQREELQAERKEFKIQLEKLKAERDELRTILEKITRRLYKIYPVSMPEEIKIGDQMGKVIAVSEIQKKMGNGEIDRMILDPLLQAYAGSHRGDNRLLTFYAKDGNIYHVRAKYDIKNNRFDEPE